MMREEKSLTWPSVHNSNREVVLVSTYTYMYLAFLGLSDEGREVADVAISVWVLDQNTTEVIL